MKISKEIYRVYQSQANIGNAEFGDIVERTIILNHPSGEPIKLRLFLVDETIVDVWYSVKGKYSYHWETQTVRGIIYRHDNAPHKNWRHISTFPKHFHEGQQDKVSESYISNDPEQGMRDFLSFVRKTMKEYLK
ncbi:MAG: DUF6516 family protein [bacterium]|nr:DUF6516 family protein [bacterium]